MKLLLDVHHSPLVAARLRDLGHDIVAASDDALLRLLPDDELLAAATDAGRAVVTENVRDFDALARRWDRPQTHAGILLTPPSRFPRSMASYPGSLIAALAAFLTDPPVEGEGWTWYLDLAGGPGDSPTGGRGSPRPRP